MQVLSEVIDMQVRTMRIWETQWLIKVWLWLLPNGVEKKAQIIDKVTAINTHGFVRENVETGSKLFTDGSPAYEGLRKDYKHRPVNHSITYVKGERHINNVETFFSHIKRSIKGTQKAISKKHLQSYLDGFVFHYNNRY